MIQRAPEEMCVKLRAIPRGIRCDQLTLEIVAQKVVNKNLEDFFRV